jgi:predicted glycoside hydrolase/deacetylase ChbG (UPF0249 family)
MTRRAVCLCADDYALAPGVSAAIRELAADGRISATSCMTVWPDWFKEASALLQFRERIDIGLHLVLTDAPTPAADCSIARGGQMGSLPALLAATHLGTVRHRDVEAEVLRQLDRFEAATGFPPAFIDGHRHIHALPVVRDVVLGLFGTRLDAGSAWLRVPTAPRPALLRLGEAAANALLIDFLSRPIERAAVARDILRNKGFYGVNRFQGNTVERLFEAWLTAPGDHPLIMCHPGIPDRDLRARDPVHEAREVEFAFLKSSEFGELLDRTQTRLVNPRR